MPNHSVVSVLATFFLAGEAEVDAIVERAGHALGREWDWLRPVARRYVQAMGHGTRPRYRDAVRFLETDRGVRSAFSRHGRKICIAHWIAGPQPMQPVRAATDWDLPPIETVGGLADWLTLSDGDLHWFADLKDLTARGKEPRLRHYYYRILDKEFGRVRLIEAPKTRLKAAQRHILEKILDRIPAHASVHGFVHGRSIRSFAAPHVGRHVVVRMDLEDFFPSFIGARIQAFLRTIGYPEPVADLLGGICTTTAPRDIWTGHQVDSAVRDLYRRPHLPQGAPTSPALANFCFYRVDCRLAGLAQSAGAAYTRYADDLAFSGDEEFAKGAARFSLHAAAILLEEGFSVHHRKTRIMRQGVRQHLAGLVVNQRQNVRRADFDRLKATLTNCIHHGPESQNRDAHPHFRAHLEGRVAFVESVHAERGRRLRDLLQQIRWPE
jgi:hypothetical protein